MRATYRADQLVFVDETGVNHHTSLRTYGWAPCGERACRRDFFVHGTKFVLNLYLGTLMLNFYSDTLFFLCWV